MRISTEAKATRELSEKTDIYKKCFAIKRSVPLRMETGMEKRVQNGRTEYIFKAKTWKCHPEGVRWYAER